MIRIILFLLVLATGSLASAQANMAVINNTTVRIASGTTLKCTGNVSITGATARISTGGTLRLDNSATTALTALSGGGILCEDASFVGNVTWNMQLAGAYTVPFVNAGSVAIPLVVTPAAVAGAARTVTVQSYPTVANNTPLPSGVSNTTGPFGAGISADMVNRFWRINSSAAMTAAVKYAFASTDDAANGITSLRAHNWGTSAWSTPPTGQSNPATREVLMPAYAFPAATNTTWALSRDAVVTPVKLAMKVFLEGPYNTGTTLMNTNLRTMPTFPLTEPYTGLGFTQTGGGGGEVINSSVLTVTGNNAIVDWVLLELRNSANSSSILATRSALVQSDGDVVDLDGTSPVSLNRPAGSYFASVRHRNHLGAMTLNAVALTSVSTTVDLSLSATATYGTGARKTVGTIQALYAGNVVPDASMKYTGSTNDRDPILIKVGSTTPNSTFSGYCIEDVNLDGLAKYTGTGNDRDPVLVNVGSTTPNAIRVQQLP